MQEKKMARKIMTANSQQAEGLAQRVHTKHMHKQEEKSIFQLSLYIILIIPTIYIYYHKLFESQLLLLSTVLDTVRSCPCAVPNG